MLPPVMFSRSIMPSCISCEPPPPIPLKDTHTLVMAEQYQVPLLTPFVLSPVFSQLQNSMTEERVHLLLDISEQPAKCNILTRGQTCEYHNAQGVIC